MNATHERPADLSEGIVAYFNQGTWWKPDGRPYVRIADMDDAWRNNCVQFLLRHARGYGQKYAFELHMVEAHASCHLSETSMDELSADIANTQEAVSRDPMTWIRGTKLFRALLADLPDRGSALADLRRRSRHWSTCDMRLGLSARPADAVCTCKPTKEVADR